MPLKSDRVLVEGAGGIYFVPNVDGRSVNVYFGTSGREENYLGCLGRPTLESYITKKTAQLQR